jgi:hypothetical protein
MGEVETYLPLAEKCIQVLLDLEKATHNCAPAHDVTDDGD